jgi:hypothetical protein
MKPLELFILLIVIPLALVGIGQVKLVSDVITATGYSATEVLSGIAVVIDFFILIVALFTMRV